MVQEAGGNMIMMSRPAAGIGKIAPFMFIMEIGIQTESLVADKDIEAQRGNVFSVKELIFLDRTANCCSLPA